MKINTMKACAVSWMLLVLHATAVAGPLNLSAYPKSDEISYGSVVAEVRPRQYIKVKAPVTGELHLKAKGGSHEQGTIWAEFEPEQIALEREAMDLARALHESKEMPLMKLEISDSRAALISRREEMERNLAMLREILKEPELAELYTGGAGEDEASRRSRVEQMESRLVDQIAAIDAVLAFVGTDQQTRDELRLAELQIDRKDRELKRREQEAKLTMPFNGELKYLVDVPDDLNKPLAIQAGQEIAEMADYSMLDGDVVVKRSELRSLPTNVISLEFARPGAPRIRATFRTQKTVELFGKNELVYVFTFPDEVVPAARGLVGGSVPGELILKLSAEATLVPKLDLVRSAPEIFKQHGWWMGVELALPGCLAISVGQTHVAIVKKTIGAK